MNYTHLGKYIIRIYDYRFNTKENIIKQQIEEFINMHCIPGTESISTVKFDSFPSHYIKYTIGCRTFDGNND